MITPTDIQNKEFAKAVRGYKEEEVDAFLDLLTVDLEHILEENRKLKETIDAQAQDLERYKGSESAVLETLEAAKMLMGDISASAEKRAQILLKNAELDAQLIQREAKESVERLSEEAVAMRNRLSAFKTKFRSLLETELEKFDVLSNELFGEHGFEDLKEFSESLSTAEPVRTAPRGININAAYNTESSKKTITNLRMGDGV